MLVRTRLCYLKALIILDNVDQLEQLEKLALHPNYLESSYSHILINCGVNKVYNVQLLDKNIALQLLCQKAFKFDDICARI
ncbi:hypothetical protein CR513_47149, partial [Mucuna pruriens]